MPGTNIAENIADAMEHSRRMIFILSRYSGPLYIIKSGHDVEDQIKNNGIFIMVESLLMVQIAHLKCAIVGRY